MDLPNLIGQTSISEIAMTILLVANGFFLARYFRQNDTLSETLTKLDKTIAVLSTQLNTLQLNDNHKTKIIERLMSKMIKMQEMLTALRVEFDSCKLNCKGEE
jgi:flagellar capping protein FliD